MLKCSINGCEKISSAKGLCSLHYQRLKKHGDIGVNFRFRQYRIMLNDASAYLPSRATAYEKDAMREIFFRGKYHGGLSINYNEATGID